MQSVQNVINFPMKTKRGRTPNFNVRLQPALRDAAEEYGKRTGIGDLSSVVRFALASLLRTDGALQVTPADKAAK